jgi:hypothetical protein
LVELGEDMQGRVNYFGKTFAEWLAEAHKVPVPIAPLINVARRDPDFPRRGDTDVVREHVRIAHADHGLIDLIPVAESHWLRA